MQSILLIEICVKTNGSTFELRCLVIESERHIPVWTSSYALSCPYDAVFETTSSLKYITRVISPEVQWEYSNRPFYSILRK